jgi:hypothetical protein
MSAAECERHVLCDCAEDDDSVTEPTPDPDWPRRWASRHVELLRQVADLTAERDALQRQVDAVDELCERARKVAGGVFVATLSSTPDPQDDRYVIVPVQTPDGVVRWRVPWEPLTIPAPGQATAGEPQRPALAPENVQEPRTPAPGSPGTPETLSVPLSAPQDPHGV